MIKNVVKNPSFVRRVVVTGMGAITPLGASVSCSWDSLLSSKSGTTSLENSLKEQNLAIPVLERDLNFVKSLSSQVAAPVKGVKYDTRTSRFVQLALVASEEASRNSGLHTWLGLDSSAKDEEEYLRRRERTGVVIGAGMSSVREILQASYNIKKLNPHFIPKVLHNSASGRVSLLLKCGGPVCSPSTACASGAHSIGDAMRYIKFGDADIMLCGGTEACIDPLSMSGFCRLRALSTQFNSCPEEASRPFDIDRDGFVLAEGSGILVLEELNHALKREANILCELIGYGLSGDGYHITSPHPNGKGAEHAMKMALFHSSLNGEDIDYINAHATSTPKGDDIEAMAISRLFEQAKDLHVSSTKGSTGHLLGAAGAIESIFTAMSIIEKKIPPTKNLSQQDVDVNFSHVMETYIEKDVNYAMCNSFGFGGTNASLIFSRYE